MNIKIELLTYEKGIQSEQYIYELMRSLCSEYDEEYSINKTKEMISFLNDGSAIIAAAFRDDILIGYAWGYLRNTRCLRIHITQLVVNEKYRSQGIGKRLLEFMEKQCLVRGCGGMELNVSANNRGARQFYLNNDFVCESLFLAKRVKKE